MILETNTDIVWTNFAQSWSLFKPRRLTLNLLSLFNFFANAVIGENISGLFCPSSRAKKIPIYLLINIFATVHLHIFTEGGLNKKETKKSVEEASKEIKSHDFSGMTL